IDAELTLTEEQCARVHMGQRLNVFDELTGKLKDYVVNMVSDQLSKNSSVDINDDASTHSKAIPISSPAVKALANNEPSERLK
ncbi:hypothetical protein SB861_66470, partial [Paraburkholderia sp. SIMBA_049]